MTEQPQAADIFAGPIKVLVPCGSLGAGVRESEIAYGIAEGAHVIASDAGSTDSGAAYLALGKSKNSRGAVKRDLQILMKAQAGHGIPIIIGTSGQAGGDLNLEWTREIVVEVAAELDMAPRIALIHCEQDKATIKRLNAEGRIHPLAPLGPLEDETVDQCEHIVAALGGGTELTVAVDYQYESLIYDDNSNEGPEIRPATHFVDARVVLAGIGDHWTLSLWGKNLSNERTRTHQTLFLGANFGTYNPPRTYGATLGWRY